MILWHKYISLENCSVFLWFNINLLQCDIKVAEGHGQFQQETSKLFVSSLNVVYFDQGTGAPHAVR